MNQSRSGDWIAKITFLPHSTTSQALAFDPIAKTLASETIHRHGLWKVKVLQTRKENVDA